MADPVITTTRQRVITDYENEQVTVMSIKKIEIEGQEDVYTGQEDNYTGQDYTDIKDYIESKIPQ